MNKLSKSWITFLEFMAWANVVLSIIAVIVYWYYYGTIEKLRPGYTILTETVTNWTAVIIGCGIIFGSLMLLGFLMVVCYIAENVNKENREAEIRDSESNLNDVSIK